MSDDLSRAVCFEIAITCGDYVSDETLRKSMEAMFNAALQKTHVEGLPPQSSPQVSLELTPSGKPCGEGFIYLVTILLAHETFHILVSYLMVHGAEVAQEAWRRLKPPMTTVRILSQFRRVVGPASTAGAELPEHTMRDKAKADSE